MHVTINHDEVTQGLMSKKPCSRVTLRVVFSEEEQFIGEALTPRLCRGAPCRKV